MPVKILRLGFTESSLLYCYWSKYYKNIIKNSEENDLIRWLYTTSGYYDKTQIGSYFDVIHKDNNYPNIYIYHILVYYF